MGWSEWKNLSEKGRLYLYKNGDQCTDITGGWANKNLYSNGGAVTFGDESITMQGSTAGTNNQYIVYANNKINFTGYKKLVVKLDTTMIGSSARLTLYALTKIPTAPAELATRYLNSVFNTDFSDSDILISLPLQGESYIVLYSFEGAKWTIKEVYLEKDE